MSLQSASIEMVEIGRSIFLNPMRLRFSSVYWFVCPTLIFLNFQSLHVAIQPIKIFQYGNFYSWKNPSKNFLFLLPNNMQTNMLRTAFSVVISKMLIDIVICVLLRPEQFRAPTICIIFGCSEESGRPILAKHKATYSSWNISRNTSDLSKTIRPRQISHTYNFNASVSVSDWIKTNIPIGFISDPYRIDIGSV